MEQLVTVTQEMARSLNTLILVEERQTTLSHSHEKLREDHDKLKEKVDKWVNRGVGVWVAVSLIATVAWAVYTNVKG